MADCPYTTTRTLDLGLVVVPAGTCISLHTVDLCICIVHRRALDPSAFKIR